MACCVFYREAESRDPQSGSYGSQGPAQIALPAPGPRGANKNVVK